MPFFVPRYRICKAEMWGSAPLTTPCRKSDVSRVLNLDILVWQYLRPRHLSNCSEMVDIIAYGYDLAPHPQKLLQFLAFFRIPYKYVEIPSLLPRPDFDSVGITYRRAPLMSIDSDMYVDTSLMIEKICDMAAHMKDSDVDATNHIEFFLMGKEIFKLAVALLPADHPAMKNEAFLKDRVALTGRDFSIEAFKANRPHAIGAMLTYCSLISRKFLAGGSKKFILGGSVPTTADLYLYWSLNWGLRFHSGARPEISSESHPEIFTWLTDVAAFLRDRAVVEKIAFSDARTVLQRPPKHEYAKFVKHEEDDPLGLESGQEVSVTPVDTGMTHPQFGTLISLNRDQVCLRNKKNLVMHFPRIGYSVKAA